MLRLASLLWRLRRATTMETGLFEIQADYMREFRQGCQVNPASREVVYALFGRADSISFDPTSHGMTNGTEAVPNSGPKSVEPVVDPAADLARCFLRLANLPSYPLDRLSRYEAILWRTIVCSRCFGPPQTTRKRAPFSVSVAGKTSRPMDASTIEPPDCPMPTRTRPRWADVPADAGGRPVKPNLQRGINMLSFLIALEIRMGQVLVRNLDDRVIESLKTKAELKGRSLEQELRDVLTNAAPLTPEEKIALFHKLRAVTPPLGDVDVRAAIRRGRDDEFDE